MQSSHVGSGQGDYAHSVAERWASLTGRDSVEGFEVLMRLVRAGRLAESMLRSIARDQGLSVVGDYEILSALRRDHPKPLTPSELVQRVAVTSGGMTGRLDRLESAGLIRREPSDEDRRSVAITATTDGIGMAESVFEAFADAAEQILSRMPAEQRREVSWTLRSVVDALGGDSPAGDRPPYHI